jgi:hypothetical protein
MVHYLMLQNLERKDKEIILNSTAHDLLDLMNVQFKYTSI